MTRDQVRIATLRHALSVALAIVGKRDLGHTLVDPVKAPGVTLASLIRAALRSTR